MSRIQYIKTMILSDRIIEGSNEYKMAYVKSSVYELGRMSISELLLKELPK
jgi:hypothetical protein